MVVQIASIVEGHGEVKALPRLIQRIARMHDTGLVVKTHPPVRWPASTLLKPDGLERAVNLAARLLQGQGCIFVLLDCEDDAPCRLGPQLLERARAERPDIPIGVALAFREFETWFVAAAESLRGQCGLPSDLQPPENPEAFRDAKKWLTDRMPPGRSYAETVDQPALTGMFDLHAARRVYSFDKCYREITRLLDELRQRQG